MYRFIAGVCLLLASAMAVSEALTIERIYGDPDLSGTVPSGLKFAPDGQRVTFLKGKDEDYEVKDLWEYHLPTGQTRMLVDSAALADVDAEMSDEEKARRERLRLSSRGITSYFWSEDGKALLFPLAGDIFYYSLVDNSARQLTDTPTFETDARISPRGNYVSFIREQNLYVLHIETGKETQLTRDGGGLISNGMAEFVAQEEMYRFTGYWWSPDESQIAFTRVDESSVGVITRSEIYADRIEMIEQRYPLTGTDNAVVELGVFAIDGGEPRWVESFGPADSYLTRVRWLPDGQRLSYQWQSRDQQVLRLKVFDTRDESTETVLTETSDTWVNLFGSRSDALQGYYFLGNRDQFLWTSERDGFSHLYLYSTGGELLKQLTRGSWVVDSLVAVDEQAGLAYFTGNREHVRQKQLYRVPLSGDGEVQRVSQRDGWHGITFAADGSAYVDTWSDANTPWQTSVHAADGKRIAWLDENPVDASHPLSPYLKNWITPAFGTLKNAEGTELHYRIYKPATADKPLPAIVYQYGGPGPQVVADTWGGGRTDLYLQYLAQQGYVVFSLDNRGSARRGKAFESALYRRMSDVELADQIAGARFLGDLPEVDAQRIGIFGHSYGGYMTLMAMFRGADVFKAGIAGAPVTLWELYDTHYTERYMGTPQSNPEGYKSASVLEYTDGLEGQLMIYHGMADDNVLFTHSTRLYKALQDEAKVFEMMDYPGKKHSIRGKNTGIHLRRSMSAFFYRHLQLSSPDPSSANSTGN